MKIIVSLALLVTSSVAFADRFDATDYECEQLAAEDLGARCLVWRKPYPQGTELLLWLDPDRPQDDASSKRRGYLMTRVAEGYVTRGGKGSTQRTIRDGQHQYRLCDARRTGRMSCIGWQPAESEPGPEWQALMVR